MPAISFVIHFVTLMETKVVDLRKMPLESKFGFFCYVKKQEVFIFSIIVKTSVFRGVVKKKQKTPVTDGSVASKPPRNSDIGIRSKSRDF